LVLFLPLLLLAWPIAEVFVAIKVAEAIGVLETLALLIVGWPLGTWAIRSQGRAVWRRLAAAVAEGRAPAREVLDGALVLIGGALLIVPGFITDALGIVFLLPPTRALMRVVLIRNLQSRVLVQAVRYTRRRDPGDVDGTATDIDQPQLRA
jgi:UPF0716 protein FxsA